MQDKKIRWENDTYLYAKGEFTWHYSGYIKDGICVFEMYEKRIGKYLFDKIEKKIHPISTKEHGEELALRILSGEKIDKLKLDSPINRSNTSTQLTLPLNKNVKVKKDTKHIEDRIKELLKKL